MYKGELVDYCINCAPNNIHKNNIFKKNIVTVSKQASHDIKTTFKYLNRASESVSPEGLTGPYPLTFPGGPVCLCMCVNGDRAVVYVWGQACV